MVAAALTWEAWSAARSHREAAQDALRDYALFAASSYADQAFNRFYLGSVAILAPVGGASQVPTLDQVYDPGVMLTAARASHDCKCRWDAEPDFAFSYRLRDSALVLRGDRLPGALVRTRLIDSLARNFDSMTVETAVKWPRPDQVWVVLDTAGGSAQLYLMTFKYGRNGVPTMLYGFATPFRHFSDRVLPHLMSAQLLPKAVTRGAYNDSLLTVTVRDANGEVLYQSAQSVDTTYAARVPLWRFAPDGPSVQLGMRPEAAAKLLSGGVPRSRLPLLAALLFLASVLVAAALLLSRRAQELTQLRSDFTSSVSHELRTPLAQILLFAETLHLGRAGSSTEKENAIQVILREARRLAHMVDNVLLFSRTEHRPVRISPLPLPLAPLVRDAAASFAPLARVHEATIVTTLEDVTAPVDPGALRQMLLNLLDNAVKYGPPGQTLTVGLALHGSEAWIWVDDQGPGVLAADRERIWQAFIRLPRGNESVATGSGIGLSVVRQLVMLHGGRCWVGTAPGGGARFVIELPGARASAVPEHPDARAVTANAAAPGADAGSVSLATGD
ncbi:MAG TPA: HAMP domain-containing sensor histidine kinase [Gemmatimonadaceae bacterium]|nr:HAMP domain-containing sensor histidine kinase [Gemmatimonadaceae bacterium]